MLAQIVAREAEVARLLGDVDLRHALDERMHALALGERHALGVVDRIFAAEHEDEEQLGEARAELDDDAIEPRPAARESPGTSRPLRRMNSANIIEWCDSSMSS